MSGSMDEKYLQDRFMKNIMLRIVGRHIGRDSSEDDRIEFVTECRAYEKNGSVYVLYDENEFSDMPGNRASLKIGRRGEIRLKRYGTEKQAGNVMEFSKGKRFSSIYNTPYGPVEMEILTNRIVNEVNPDSLTGHLMIDYDIALRGLAESRTLLDVELYEGSVRQ